MGNFKGIKTPLEQRQAHAGVAAGRRASVDRNPPTELLLNDKGHVMPKDPGPRQQDLRCTSAADALALEGAVGSPALQLGEAGSGRVRVVAP